MAKYKAFSGPKPERREWPDRTIQEAPTWCSVDLRDGNQALVNPMSVKQKMAMFNLLCKIGFKEIEIGFPSASQIEFEFMRALIMRNAIPADVTPQVLCQTREELIARTADSLVGAKRVIFHLYTSTSPVQREVTFGMSRDEVKAMAIKGVRELKKAMARIPDTEIILEFSPESFSATEVDYALDVCEAVMDEWGASAEKKIILNLPNTVETASANVFADQVEWFRKHLKRPEAAILSVHTHNDRGGALAAAELALLAGARRVEGTLFGNGERSGNMDVVAAALNLFTQGIDPQLDFSDLPAIVAAYVDLTGMEVPLRQPYSGELVFTAFSGSHQDAIKKGLDKRQAQIAASGDESRIPWEVAYLPIDPKDLGRSYEAIIRVNSQSGKGGAAFLLKERYGYELPKPMQAEFGRIINKRADEEGKELPPEKIYSVFETEYLKTIAPLSFESIIETGIAPNGIGSSWTTRVVYRGDEKEFNGTGTGPIDAFMNSVQSLGLPAVRLTDFHEHSVGEGAETQAVAYVEMERKDGRRFWGCGLDGNIAQAGVKAALCALNRATIDWELHLQNAPVGDRHQ
jgi:2-isopropylmalate synthase